MKIINGKSAADLVQLKDREARGFKTMELHLFDDQPGTAREAENIIEILRNTNMTTTVIHTPIQNRYSVERFHQKEEQPVMESVLGMAEKLACLQQVPVLVVIHQELTLEMLRDFGLLRGIEDTLARWLKKYPHIQFGLENLSLANLENGSIRVRNSYFIGPTELATHLGVLYETDRIGTVLDTCHMLSSIRIMEKLGETTAIEDYFRIYKDTLKLIHLSNARGLGFKESHGTDFSGGDDEMLIFEEIIRNIKDYVPNAMITVETNELDVRCGVRMEKVKNHLEGLQFKNLKRPDKSVI